MPQQLAKDVFESVVLIGIRDAGQFAKGWIPGAPNIEWREVLGRIDQIPRDRKVILFCNTGSLSAQAAFALRVAGRENVLVLQTGICAAHASMRARSPKRIATSAKLRVATVRGVIYYPPYDLCAFGQARLIDILRRTKTGAAFIALAADKLAVHS